MATKLNPNDDLAVIKTLTSPDGRFNLTMQTDGNLVLYGPGGEPRWHSGTYGQQVAAAVMQGDGNFVLYDSNWKPIWHSGTYGHPGAWLSVQNDGKVVIYDASGKSLCTLPPAFIDTKNLVTQLIQLKSADPTKKIAFVFSGGGARAAWFGGVLEAVEREVRRQQPNIAANRRFAPDLLVGTSGGALAAVGYFADLLNPGEYGPYVNRQSWLWREIARGNEAAFRLLDNPGVLELLSGSKTGKGQIDWSSIKNKPLSTFLTVANIPNPKSPTYNFNNLIKSASEIGTSVKLLESKWKSLYGSLVTLYSDSSKIISRITTQNLATPWVNTINSVVVSISGIKGQVDGVKVDLDFIKEKISSRNKLGLPVLNDVNDALGRLNSLLSDGGAIVISVINGLFNVHNSLLSIPVGTITNQFSDIDTLFKDIKKVLEALHDLNKTFGNTVGDVADALFQLSLVIDDAINFIIAAAKMIDANASLMNVTGLKNVVHEVLRLAVSPSFSKNGASSDLDDAIFKHWKAQRDAKLADPLVRAPELILTGANITANRLGLFTLCDGQSAINLASSKRWVIGLNFKSTGFLRGMELKSTAKADPSNPKDPHHWVFGAWADNYIDPSQSTIEELVLPSYAESASHPVPSTPKTKSASVTTPPDSPFEHLPGVSMIKGTSVIAAAALTTAAIPIAFPPRCWRFENPFLKKTYYHWFVDGGLCDNRPIQQALDAGADYIVSFEVTPLRKAIADIPSIGKKPNFMGVISAMTDTQLNSPFYRFIETYVEENPGTEKKMWRLAPEAGAGEEDETIGVYDFNGYWNKGTMKMGLFDWFMLGYLDAEKSVPLSQPPAHDPVRQAYANMPEYGQVGNAAQKRPSPGYFVVDFENNNPHPGYL